METNETNNGQARAPKGGCVGVNGEFYEGGKFLPGNEDRPKTAPGLRAETPLPAYVAERREREAKAARMIGEWLIAKRQLLVGICQALVRRPFPVEFNWVEALRYSCGTGALASIGVQLWRTGSVTNRQADCICRALYGRRSKNNFEAYERTARIVTVECPDFYSLLTQRAI